MNTSILKNAIAYAVTPGFVLDPELLARRSFMACGPLDTRTDGFVAPCEHSTRGLVHDVAGIHLIYWQTEDKLLPGSVIAEVAEERAKELEEQQGFKLGRKQMKALKEQVTDELLPQAFTQRRRTFALFIGGLFLIDTSSNARAESLLGALSDAIGPLPLRQLSTVRYPGAAITGWLLGEVPADITLDQSCVIESSDAESGGAITLTGLPVDGEDVRARIAQGFRAKKVAATFKDRLSAVVDDGLTLKRISLLDVARPVESPDSAADEFDTDVLIMASEVSALLDYLVAEFGGLLVPAADLASDGAGDQKQPLPDSPDAAYSQAVEIVTASGRASISTVQRHLRIGYNFAARLIERMEQDGIVSKPDAQGIRTVIGAAAGATT